MIAGKRQTTIEAVEYLFYRLTIDAEAPLNAALFKEVIRRHEGLGDYRGQLKGWGAFGIF